VLALVLKLTLAPALVAAATVVARRLGPRAGGLISGLPVVAGPIVLIYAVEQGPQFTRVAAAAAVLGIVAQVAFCVAYAAAARRANTAAALAAAALVYAAAIAALSAARPPLAVSAVAALVAVGVGIAATRRLQWPGPRAAPSGDLLAWRLLITAALVLGLTGVAHGLSAHLAGLLVPLPIITGVLAGFTHSRAGASAAIELLHGLSLAFPCFWAFFVALAALLGHASVPLAFALATVAALACWIAMVAVATSLHPGRPRPALS
jgi:hypothetical protein